MTGIDISQWQSAIAPGTWDFIFARATHDGLGVDLMFDRHFPNALTRSSRRGAYHFAKPIVSTGAAQAQHFAQVCKANGFRVGVDAWALDFEANALGSHAANVAWIRDFMATARTLLGARGLLYVGWPYFVETCGEENLALLHEHPWWLPAYGPNDGQPHTYSAPFIPCVHQYTSRGGVNLSGLDVNRVLDTAAWARLFTSEVLLHSQFAHALGIVSWCQFTHPTLGPKCVAAVDTSGAVFCLPADAYLGGANGKPYFAGRHAATITAATPTGYTITDTAKEPYHFIKKA